ncbi:hypothetical protein DMP16_04065 [Sulfolobus sp. B1]|nr:hypothetical protein DJ532_12585 [Sulfolobus sp. A20-N-F8]TRM76535.1 hypothetical protein DJ523_00875 [Sulfolobus sp. E5]TRM81175.1 hypothetical protein DJ524_05010 [Sulfolobus sp. D5]TRM87594.1 hypothetical protein DJ529_07920 [Sulfolobus sp. C3]TRM97047.1 hypothetical protein DMP16_04065 [Sulfolobus sp. B1]
MFKVFFHFIGRGAKKRWVRNQSLKIHLSPLCPFSYLIMEKLLLVIEWFREYKPKSLLKGTHE